MLVKTADMLVHKQWQYPGRPVARGVCWAQCSHEYVTVFVYLSIVISQLFVKFVDHFIQPYIY